MNGGIYLGGLVLALVTTSVRGQVTLADIPPKEVYACGRMLLSCPFGFIVEIQPPVEYGHAPDGCDPDTIADAPKTCQSRVPDLFEQAQLSSCESKNTCAMQNFNRNLLCRQRTNFARLSYGCKFVGFNGQSTPMPTSPAPRTPDLPADDIYTCGRSTIVCPSGFIVEIQTPIVYGRVEGDCSADTVRDAPKTCQRNVGGTLESFQLQACSNHTSCPVFDLTGYPLCGQINFVRITYICKWVGYDGLTLPTTTTSTTTPTTTVPTSTTTSTTTVATPSSVRTTTASTTSVTTVATSRPVPTTMSTIATTTVSRPTVETTQSDETTESVVTDVNTSAGQSSTPAKSTKTPDEGATAGQDLDSEEKRNLIIGVSVSAVVLLLIIILLVECKRQNRRKRSSETYSPMEEKTEGDVGPTDTTSATDNSVDEEIVSITNGRERRFKKKGETNPEFADYDMVVVQPSAVRPVIIVEDEKAGSSDGAIDGRDSGVSALFSDEISAEHSNEDGGSPEGSVGEEPETSGLESPGAKRTRHVTFSDVQVNTEMSAVPRAGESESNIRDVPRNPALDPRNPDLDPAVSGPASEREVLY